MNRSSIFYIMGVSGCGKSTIGQLLANELGIPFFDGDRYHSQANIAKMASGTPLNDEDREGWLETLNQLAKENLSTGAVIVCSALKAKYRNVLMSGIENKFKFIFLKGSLEQISQRLSLRQGHFMPKELLQSQFDTLEEPTNAIVLSIDNTPKEMVAQAIKLIEN